MTEPSQTLPLADLDATRALAAAIAALARAGEAVTLVGDLGAGKTQFSRYFIQSLTSADTEVLSPTFTLLQTYDASAFSIWHFDLYRLQSAKDTIELGIDEAFDEGVSLIEWPQIIEGWLPKNRLSVELAFGDREGKRVASLTGHGNWVIKLQTLMEQYEQS